MPSRLQQVIAKLELVKPDEYGDCVPALYEVLADFKSIPNRGIAVPIMFAVIERYSDADLGSPGPLVHEIEAVDGYEPELEASLARRPTVLACWMVNRILNQAKGVRTRQHWISVLHGVVASPSASEAVRAEARQFLEYQSEQG